MKALALATVIFAFVVTGIAHAQPSSSQRDAAIMLGEEGLRLLDQGEHEAALQKFEAADDLVPAPTFGVRAALCLEYLGRLVEALHRYERVMAMEVDPDWPTVHRRAQREAHERAADLRKRVARLYVMLRGDRPEQASVELDGRDLAYEDLASAVLLDPGSHSLEVTYRDRVERREIHVKEGEQHQQEFLLASGRDGEPAPRASAQRTAGWVGVGLGAAGIALGAVTGLVAWSKSGDLESRCPDHVCPPEAWSDNESYYRWRNVSTTGFAVGAITLGAGTVLLLTDSSKPPEADVAKVEPWIGLGSAGVRGGF